MTTARQHQYQEVHINTASPMELVLIMYDEAIKSLDKAEAAFSIDDPSRIEAIGNQILHAQDSIAELAIALDMEKGGEIAMHLKRLYDFMMHHLSQANLKKNLKSIREVRKMLVDLRESWSAVALKESEMNKGATRQAPSKSSIMVAG